jgi:hypothetical protein
MLFNYFGNFDRLSEVGVLLALLTTDKLCLSLQREFLEKTGQFSAVLRLIMMFRVVLPFDFLVVLRFDFLVVLPFDFLVVLPFDFLGRNFDTGHRNTTAAAAAR